MAGIKQLEDVILFGGSLANAIDGALQDGYSWDDLVALLPPFTKLPAALDGLDEVLDELYDLDSDEKAELSKFIEEEFDFKSDKSEEIAEQSVVLVTEIAKLVLLIREAKKE